MNALLRILLPFVPEVLSVLHRDWLLLDEPELHVMLSNGSYLKIQWDLEGGCVRLFLAADKQADFTSCSREDIGLDGGELEVMIDAVKQAVKREEDERLADQCDDGREG